MKKILMSIILSSLFFVMTGCANEREDIPVDEPSNQTETIQEDENKDSENILIAYFTWGDNTIVEHPENVDVDASTSASVLQPGNVAMMASWIQEEIGGDLFSIQVTEPYSSDYDECLDRAAEEKAENARPALKDKVENIDEYDTVFLGYPNWWYSAPMAVLSFIEENDLSDKNIVLFCSHGTGGLANSVNVIRNHLPDSVNLEENVVGVYRNDISEAQPVVQEWLHDIGYGKE